MKFNINFSNAKDDSVYILLLQQFIMNEGEQINVFSWRNFFEENKKKIHIRYINKVSIGNFHYFYFSILIKMDILDLI